MDATVAAFNPIPTRSHNFIGDVNSANLEPSCSKKIPPPFFFLTGSHCVALVGLKHRVVDQVSLEFRGPSVCIFCWDQRRMPHSWLVVILFKCGTKESLFLDSHIVNSIITFTGPPLLVFRAPTAFVLNTFTRDLTKSMFF